MVDRAQNGSPADLLVVCEIFKLAMHGHVLIKKVDFVAKALAHNMKEKKKRTITAEGEDPFVIQALLYFAYQDEYSDEGGNDQAHPHRSTVNAKVYALAGDWQYPLLKSCARDMLMSAVDKTAKSWTGIWQKPSPSPAPASQCRIARCAASLRCAPAGMGIVGAQAKTFSRFWTTFLLSAQMWRASWRIR